MHFCSTFNAVAEIADMQRERESSVHNNSTSIKSGCLTFIQIPVHIHVCHLEKSRKKKEEEACMSVSMGSY